MAIHIDFMGNEVLWDIAKDSKGNIVRINEVYQGPYVCLECNHEMFQFVEKLNNIISDILLNQIVQERVLNIG